MLTDKFVLPSFTKEECMMRGHTIHHFEEQITVQVSTLDLVTQFAEVCDRAIPKQLPQPLSQEHLLVRQVDPQTIMDQLNDTTDCLLISERTVDETQYVGTLSVLHQATTRCRWAATS
jgi:hypothetical protein